MCARAPILCSCVCVVDCQYLLTSRDLHRRADYYTLIEWGSSMFGEETDLSLAEYPLPEQVETLIDKGNVETKITKVMYMCSVVTMVTRGQLQENYCRRMHNLLYVEEYQHRKDLSRLDCL